MVISERRRVQRGLNDNGKNTIKITFLKTHIMVFFSVNWFTKISFVELMRRLSDKIYR